MKLYFGILFLLALAAVMGGCASLPKEEALYQAVSAVDFAQTVHIARRPECFKETGFPTASIIGAHPSESAVEGWWAVQALGHAAISRWLKNQSEASDDDGWRHIYRAWQFLTISYAGYNVAHNHRLGIEPFWTVQSKRCAEFYQTHSGGG